MIGRIIWFAALLAIAVITTALQLDRQSQRSPAFASLVPAPFRNYAQAQIAAAAAKSNNAEIGLAEAERLVRQRPIPGEHLSLLAVAQTKAGQAEKAGLTIQIAGQRGWREPLAQEAVLRLALAAGDEAEAARRYTALFLRRSTPDALLQELGPGVLGKAGGPGRETMISIVSGAERWHNMFLRRGPRVMPPEAFAEIAAQSMERGTRFDCRTLKLAINALANRSEPAAERLRASPRARACLARQP